MPQPQSVPDSLAPSLAPVRGRLIRYRVMAWVTGVMLLLLCLEMLAKYVFQLNGVDADGGANPVIGNWVALAHGWIYVVYLFTVAQLWSAIRWPGIRLVTMVIAGVVPVMSFVVEHRVHGDAVARLAQAERALAEAETGGRDTRTDKPLPPTTLGE